MSDGTSKADAKKGSVTISLSEEEKSKEEQDERNKQYRRKQKRKRGSKIIFRRNKVDAKFEKYAKEEAEKDKAKDKEKKKKQGSKETKKKWLWQLVWLGDWKKCTWQLKFNTKNNGTCVCFIPLFFSHKLNL